MTNQMSVTEYLDSLDDDRREVVSAVRDTVNAHLPEGFVEGIQYGMISWYVPLERFAATYNGQPLTLVSLASQKRHLSLYLMGIYADQAESDWFVQAWTATGKRLDMGKSCVRFRRLEDVPLEVIGQTVARTSVEDLIVAHERVRS